MRDVFYRGSTGNEIHFNRHPYYLNRATDLLSHKWGYTNNEYVDRIESFSMRFAERKFDLGIIEPSDVAYGKALQDLNIIFDYDVITRSHGRLYVGDDYLRCYVIENSQSTYDTRANKVLRPYKLIAEDGRWIREKIYSTIPDMPDGTDKGIDYPYDYPYDYAYDVRWGSVKNDTVSGADFVMTIYGACTMPGVYIGEQEYYVNIEIDLGEKLVIDSIAKTLLLYHVDGTVENVFSRRGRESDIFAQIPSGEFSISRNDNFDVRLQLFEYRSEPEWWKIESI